MAKADSVAAKDGRLCDQLAAGVDPKLQDALDHPIRRELLRTLSRRSTVDSMVELRGFDRGNLDYHLKVLLYSGTVAAISAGVSTNGGDAQYVFAMDGDKQVRAILRATEQQDREWREAVAAANASPLLTMFRIPRPVRTIRLRGRGKVDSERER